MKKIKGIKKILIMVLLSVALVFTIGGFKNTFQAQAAGETCTYTYAAYSKEGYETLQNARIIDEDGDCSTTIDDLKALIATYEALKTTGSEGNKKKKFWTDGDGKRFRGYIDIPQLPDGSYNEDDENIDWDTIIPRGDGTNEGIYNALKAELAAWEAKNPPLTAITPGQEIVVEIYAELSTSGQIRAVAATLDLEGAIDSTAGITPYYNKTETANGATTTLQGISSTSPTIGWQYSAATGKAAAAGKVFVGAFGVTTSSTGSGFTVTLADAATNNNSGKTLFIPHATGEQVNDSFNTPSKNSRFLDEPLELAGATISDDTSLMVLTVDGKSILTGTGPQYAASDEITGNKAAVFAQVKDNGTIENTGYVYKTNPTLPATGTANAPSGSTGTVSIAAGNFDVDMSGVSAGDSVWVVFRAIASDTVAKKWYSVQVTKAKDTNCDLEAVEIKATVSGTSTPLLTETSSLTSQTEFNVYYPKGTTTSNSFTIKPTFTAPKTATLNGATATSNAVTPLTSISNGSVVTIVVKAQDTSKTKTYKFTFYEADTKPISVTGYSGPSSNVQSQTGEYATASKKFTLNNMALGRDGFWLNIVLPTNASAELFDTNKTTSLGTITSGTNTSTISYPTTANDAASTKTVWIKVTNNGYTDWYEVEVNRPKADNDKSGVTITAMGYVDANNANQTYTLPSALPTNNSTNITNTPKLTYNSKTASFVINVPSGSKTKILNASGVDITGQTQTLTLDAGKTNLQKTFNFYVQTEYDRTQSQPQSNGTQYTIVIEEEPANGTKTLDKLEVKNSSGATLPKPAPTMSGGVTIYNYDIDTDLNGNTFTVDLAWSPATTKAYVGKTVNPSTEYNASTTYDVGDTVYVRLVAEDETVSEYRIVTTKAKSSNNKIISIMLEYEAEDGSKVTVFPASAFNQGTTTYNTNQVSSLTVPYSVKSVNYTVVLDDAKSSLSVGGVNNNQSNITTRTGTYTLSSTLNNLCIVYATAENGTRGTQYTITIYRQTAKSGNYIESISIGGVDCTVANANYFKDGIPFNLNQRGASYHLYLPCTQSLNGVEFTISDGATATWTAALSSGNTLTFPFVSNVTHNLNYTFTIRVVSEQQRIDNPTNPQSNTYTFNVHVADQDHSLTDLELQDSSGNIVPSTSNVYLDLTNIASYSNQNTPFEVPYEVDSIVVDAKNTKPSFHGKINVEYGGNSNALNAGATKKVTITVTSEMAALDTSRTDLITTYTLYVRRKDCDHDQTLKTLTVSIDGTPVGVALENNKYTYVIDSLTAGDTVDIQATVNDSSSTITGQTGQHTITGLLDYTGKDSTKRELTYHIYVSCKCGTKTAQDYVIKLQTDEYKPDTTPGAITAITAETKESGGLNPSYSTGTTSYEVNLSNKDGDDYVKFTITKANPLSSLHFSIDGQVQSPVSKDATQIFTVSNIALASSKEIKVWTVAEDGTTLGTVYTITIKRAEAASTANEATMIYYNGTNQVPNFNKSSGGPYTINLGNQKEIYFTVDLTGVKNATVKQNVHDSYANRYQFADGVFTETFTIIVKAESGDEKNYNIIVNRDGDKVLDGLTATIDSDSTDKLTPTFSVATLKYKVTLTSTQKSVTLTYVPKANNGATTVSFIDPSGTPIALPAGTTMYTISNIMPTFNAAGVDTPLVYKVRVTAVSGAYEDYVIEISKERGSDTVYIDSYTYKENTTDAAEKPLDGLSPAVTTYSYRVDRNTLYFNPTITLNDPNGKVVWPTNRSMIAGQRNAMTVKVIPASGVGSKPDGSDDESNAVYYTFNVYPCDITYEIDDIFALLSDQSANLLDKDEITYIDYRNNVLEITVPYGKSPQLDTYLDIKSTADNYTIFLNGNPMTSAKQSLTVGRNEFKIQIKSDYATAYDKVNTTPITGYKSNVITVIINRDTQNDDATLKDLWVTYIDANGQEQTIHCSTLPGNDTFAVPYLGDGVTVVSVGATPNAQTSTVSGTGTISLSGTGTTGQTFNISVTCTAESGKKITYPITIARGAIDFDKDNSILEIIVEADGKTYLAQPDSNPQTNFDKDVFDYGVFKIPFSAKDYKITVVRPDGTYSTTWIDGSPRTSNTLTTTITSAMRGGSKDVVVYCVAKDPEVGKGNEYTIHLEFESASTDSTLSNLKADGTTVPGFSPNITEYTLPSRPNTTEVIDIEYVTTDPKAKVSGDIGRQALKQGLNTFAVTVTAEDGSSTTYKINVIRDYPLPYLTDLGAIGEKLLDANYKTTTFDKEVYTYTTIVSYMTLYATIKAEVDNPDFVVSCSNSTLNSKTDLVRMFDVNLAEGKNEFTLTVTSKEGKTVEYTLIIKRRGLASTNTEVEFIDILQIPEFKEAYTDDERYYSYEVPNGIKTLDVKVTPAQGPTEDGDGATFKIINGRESGVLTDQNVTLRVGKNTLVILIIAEDGESTRAIVVEVTRAPMTFSVDTEAYSEYTCEKKENGEYAYKINLVDKRAADIQDYTKYIVFDEEYYDSTNQYVEKPEVTVISDTSNRMCTEVIVRIYDGDEEIFVTFELESKALQGGNTIPEILQIIMPWILLAIAIIILIIILICVNRDKFGAINKKRKKDDEQEA